MQNVVANGTRVSAPQIHDFAVLLGFFLCGVFHKATDYIAKQIFMQNTSGNVVPGKELPFGVSITICDIYTFKFRKNRHFGDRF